jgi:signal transduction histidine kinase
MRRRLHLQIFRALVLTGLLCFGVTMTASWLFKGESRRMPRFVQGVGSLILADLPAHDDARYQRALTKRSQLLHASLSVWSRDGHLQGSAGKRLGPDQLQPSSDLFEHSEHSLRVKLADGRTLGIAIDEEVDHYRAGFALMIGMVLGTLLLGSYMAAKRITRRLEKLERGVTRFGEGRLDVRVQVRGRDEIARLAFAFNRSFDRIAGLLKQQRRMLQSASHELRSPLARLRMALELASEPNLPASERERLRTDATRDIEELDALIGDLLLAGRLADTELPKDFCEVSLREIVDSEAQRVSASSDAADVVLTGNARMLRSLVRNLLENARRHGKDPIRATLTRQGSEAVLVVQDGGEGVPSDDRERIFEPFYRPVGHREGKDGGVGLGLSLVKTIAEHHGGAVRYVPTPEGSKFEVRLPGARMSTAPRG